MAGAKKICPVCDRQFESADDDLLECPDDQSVLVFEAQDPYVGTIVSDRYEVLCLLGKGATSSVYKAKDKNGGGMVALKILHPHLASEGPVVRRLQQEARSLKELKHRNIVQVLNFSTTRQGQPYLVLEFLDGSTLLELFKENFDRVPLTEKLELFMQLMDGLQVAHEKGIVHRDLKPGNIMIVLAGDDRLAKILDFGIAKLFPMQGETFFRLTQTGEMMGSLLYMSPEQCLEQDWDERADIYSMACVMYEAVTGRPPLCGRTAFDTMNKHLSEMPVAPSAIRPDINFPAGFDSIFLKAMAKKPDDRYANILEMKADFLAVMTNKMPKAANSPPVMAPYIDKALPVPDKDTFGVGELSFIMLLAGVLCYCIVSFIGNVVLADVLFGFFAVCLLATSIVMALVEVLPGKWLNLDLRKIFLPGIDRLLPPPPPQAQPALPAPSQASSAIALERTYKDASSLLLMGVPILLIVPAVVLMLTHQLALALWTFYGLVVLGGANLLILWLRMALRTDNLMQARLPRTGLARHLPGNLPVIFASLSHHQRTALALVAVAGMGAPLFLFAVRGAFAHAVLVSPLIAVSLACWMGVSALLLLFSMREVFRFLRILNYVPFNFKEAHQQYVHALSTLREKQAMPLGYLEYRRPGRARGTDVLSIKTEKPHLLVTGSGGTGKTRLLASFVAHDLEAGERAVLALDSSGALVDLVTGWIASQPNGRALAARVHMIDLSELENLAEKNGKGFESKEKFKAAIAARSVILVKCTTEKVMGLAPLLFKDYCRAARELKAESTANTSQESALSWRSAIYVDRLGELIPLASYSDCIHNDDGSCTVIGAAASLGYLNGTSPVEMNEELLKNARMLGGLCVFRADEADARMVGPSILPKEEGVPKPSHILRLRSAEPAEREDAQTEWFEPDYFPKEWQRQARLIAELPAQTFFWHEIGRPCGVVRLVAPDFIAVQRTEIDWSIIDEISRLKLD